MTDTARVDVERNVLDQFRATINQATGIDDDLDLARGVTHAAELVFHHVGSTKVPRLVLELAVLEVARELYTRRDAPDGVLSPFGDAAPIRLARDPLKAAYPILAPYLGGGFA